MDIDLANVVVNAELFGKKRKPHHENDFGDTATVGLHLKRRGIDFADLKDHDFGIYLGSVNNKFHVGTMAVYEFAPTKLVSYDNLNDLKKAWTLD